MPQCMAPSKTKAVHIGLQCVAGTSAGDCIRQGARGTECWAMLTACMQAASCKDPIQPHCQRMQDALHAVV